MSMPDPALNEPLPDSLLERRAVRAWSRLRPNSVEPARLEVLKRRAKTPVYRLEGVGPDGATVIAKRCHAKTATVEWMIYKDFLARLPMPALGTYGFLPEPDGESCWLFIEDAGPHKYSPANEEHRALAGCWLATVHRSPSFTGLQAVLPDRGHGHYLQRLGSARAGLLRGVENAFLHADEAALLRTLLAQCEVIQTHWPELERCFEDFPPTLVHGDFVSKNLRIQNAAAGPALLVFDWEMAGWGVPATDLAQSIGKAASPDLEAYAAVFDQDHPQFELGDLQRLARFGNLLRVVDKIFWETVRLTGESYELLLRPLTTLREYVPQLAAALRALDWTWHD